MDLFRLDGKVAVVTGASSGLGVAFAQGLAEAGADLALGARRTGKLEETAALVHDAGRRAVTVATDVADPDDCQALVDAAMAGDAIYREDLPLVMNRKGHDEQTRFTFSYSPVRDADGTWLDAADALAAAGITPVELAEKEGLALINGTDGMLGMLCLAITDLRRLVTTADISASMSVEGLLGTDDVFAADLAKELGISADKVEDALDSLPHHGRRGP